MSRISEYLSLIPKGIPNALELIEGISNNIKLKYNTLPEDEKEEIVKRRLICESCPFNSKNALSSEEYKSATGDNYKTDRMDLHCSFCGCPVESRTASLKMSCGISAWNKDNPSKQLPIKWNIYGN